MILYSDKIYTDKGKFAGYLTIKNEKIEKISESRPQDESEIIDFSGKSVIPGFIDIHIHGWGTGSFWKNGSRESLMNMRRDLIDTGVTSFLATTGADKLERINELIKIGAEVISEQQPQDGSEILGFHLEGPFINKEYKGMQKAECCIDPEIKILENFIKNAGEGNIKILAIAPELKGAKETIKFARNNGIKVSAAHTSATFDEMAAAKDWGLECITHTYSGMRGFHHREPGVVGAAMYFDELYAEFAKQSGITVRPEAFEIMHRLKGSDKIILTTDCVGMAMVDKEFHHYVRKATFIPSGNNLIVKHDDGREEILDRTSYKNIKDIELSYLGSVKNLFNQGYLTLEDIVKMTSLNPAKFIGVDDKKGSISIGKDADILVLDEGLNLVKVYMKGKEVLK